MSTITILWHEKLPRNCTDILPSEWFSEPGVRKNCIHDVLGPRTGAYQAKCDVTVHATHADLDYSPYASFNTERGMLLGVMRLRFDGTSALSVKRVLWRDSGKRGFVPIAATVGAQQEVHRMNERLFSSCVFTVRDSRKLAAAYASGGSGEFTERSRWTTGHRMLQEARQSQQRVAVLFAPAEADIMGGISYWALIDDIALTSSGTTVKFSSLQYLAERRPLSSLKKLSNGESLSDRYIRPYVPCRTPGFLLSVSLGTAAIIPVPDIEAEEISAREGAASTRRHLHRERDRTIIAAKRRRVLAATRRLACSVCGFDFRQFYGELGAEFCEVHHLRPLADADGEVQTRLEDLAVVCSNCHRMLHRSHPFLTLEQLKSKIRNARLTALSRRRGAPK